MSKDRLYLYECEEMNWAWLEDYCKKMQQEQSGQEFVTDKASMSKAGEELMRIETHIFVDECLYCSQKATSIFKKHKILWESPEKPNEG